MHFLIYGSGAVGMYLGGRLIAAGHRVTFLARPATAAALAGAGLRVEQGAETATFRDFEILTRLPPALDLGASSAVLLAVRAFDGPAAADELASKVRGTTPVVCLLNGIGNEEMLAKAIGVERVIPATLTTAVTATSPGLVRIERERGLGLAGGPTGEQLARAFGAAGIRTRAYRDGASMKWSKVPTNIVANAASAILDASAAAVMGNPGLYRLEVEAQREVFRVMRRAGLRPVDLPGVPIRILALGIFLPTWASRPWFRTAVAGGRGEKRPSFHRDIGRGRSEVRWLNGAIVEHGRRLGLPTPANAVLLETLLDLVEGRADPDEWRGRAQRLVDRARSFGVPGLR